jgi:hypothetical protein
MPASPRTQSLATLAGEELMSTEPDPDPTADTSPGDSEAATSAASERWPLGFLLTIVMVSLYVGYRLIQLSVKLFQWLL